MNNPRKAADLPAASRNTRKGAYGPTESRKAFTSRSLSSVLRSKARPAATHAVGSYLYLDAQLNHVLGGKPEVAGGTGGVPVEQCVQVFPPQGHPGMLGGDHPLVG